MLLRVHRRQVLIEGVVVRGQVVATAGLVGGHVVPSGRPALWVATVRDKVIVLVRILCTYILINKDEDICFVR